MTNKYLEKSWTAEDLDLAKFITKSREWPELIGEAGEMERATVKRYKVEKKFEWERPRLRLYWDIYNNFKHWLFYKQTNTKFWCELEDLSDALMMYLKENSRYGKPDKEDCKKIDAVIAELDRNLPEMYSNGPEAWIPEAEKVRKAAQHEFLNGAAKNAFLSGLLTLSDVAELYKFEFLERTCSDDWFVGWSMAAAIEMFWTIQDNKKNGRWEGKEE